MNDQTKKPEDLQAEVAILKAQLKGARSLIRHMQDKLEEVTTERNQLAGIGIECGCGEADCTADADNLRDALAHISRLIYAGDKVAKYMNTRECEQEALEAWNKAKGGKPTK